MGDVKMHQEQKVSQYCAGVLLAAGANGQEAEMV
jgi:hypothetical protein